MHSESIVEIQISESWLKLVICYSCFFQQIFTHYVNYSLEGVMHLHITI